MTVYLPCPCLNVTVHLMKNPTRVFVSSPTTTTSSPAPTTTTTTASSSSSSSRIDNIFAPLLAETGWPEVLKGALSLGGVSIQHTELVFTREVKEWQISTCVNCKCDVYAVSTSNDSFVYINPALLNTPAQPNPYNRSPSPSTNNNTNNNNNGTNNGEAIEKKFSPAFHVMVDAKAPSITEEGKAPTYGNEEEMALFDMLQASFTKFVDEEQHQMAQRIAAYTEQESRELERVRLRALRDRDALWSKIKSYLNERNRKVMHPTALYPASSHNGISNGGNGGHNSGNGRTQRAKRGPKKGTTESHSKKVSSQSPSTNSPFKSSNSQQSTTPSSPSKQLQQQQQQQQHPRSQTPADNMRIETSPSPSPTQRLSPLVLARPQPHQPQVQQQQQQQQQSRQHQQTWARSTTPTQRRQISDSVVTVAAAIDKNAVTTAGSGDVFRLDEDDDTDFGYDEDYDEDDDVAGKESCPLKSEKTNISDSDSGSNSSSCSNSGCRDTPMINASAAVRCEKPPYAMDIDDDDDDDVAVEPKKDSGRGMYIGQRPCPPRPQGAGDCHPNISSSLPIPIRGAATRAVGGGSGGGGNGSGSSGGSGGAESLRSKRQYHYTQHQQQKPVVLPQQHLYTRYGIQQRNNVHSRNRGNSKKCPASFSGDGLQVVCDEEDDDRESNDVSSSFKVPLSLNKNTKAFLYI